MDTDLIKLLIDEMKGLRIDVKQDFKDVHTRIDTILAATNKTSSAVESQKSICESRHKNDADFIQVTKQSATIFVIGVGSFVAVIELFMKFAVPFFKHIINS